MLEHSPFVCLNLFNIGCLSSKGYLISLFRSYFYTIISITIENTMKRQVVTKAECIFVIHRSTPFKKLLLEFAPPPHNLVPNAQNSSPG